MEVEGVKSQSASFIMLRMKKLIAGLVVRERVGEKRTSLHFRAAVTYIDTLLCSSIAEHTSHPIG